MIAKLKVIYGQLVEIEGPLKKKLILIGSVLFLLFFSYPMTRTTTTSMLLESFGAKGSPYAWIFSVVVLSISVYFFNRSQKSRSIHSIFKFITIATLLLFALSYLIYRYVNPVGAYCLYVIKEVYIVIMVNAVLAFLNVSITKDLAKIIYGPLGAFSSLGGIIGAFLTSGLSSVLKDDTILLIGLILVVCAGVIFTKTKSSSYEGLSSQESDTSKDISPIASIENIKSFVALIALVIMMSQFVINMANYEFNFFLTEHFVEPGAKTGFLGKIYGLINTLSLLVQLLFIPFILKYIPSILTHISIPVMYFVVLCVPLVFGAGLTTVSLVFITYKGLDYSLFSAAKELLYFNLTDKQKYGAKYIVDMIFYRFSKGLISLVLIFLPPLWIKPAIMFCLFIWLASLVPLFKKYKKLGS